MSSSSEKRFRNPLRAARVGRLAATLETAEWWWRCRVAPIALRVSAVALGFFSILTVWGETFMWTTQTMDGVDVSPFSAMLRLARGNNTGMHVAVIVPLGYMCFCAMFSLFRLGMFSFYSLVPGGTDSFSLLLNASLTCRFAAPLSLNFLMMVSGSIHEMSTGETYRNTVLQNRLASNIPKFANTFNAVFPAFIAVFCGALLWKGFLDKILRAFLKRDDSERFKFTNEDDDDDRDVHVTDGKRACDRERSEMNATGSVGDVWHVGKSNPYFVDLGVGVACGITGAGADEDNRDAGVESRGLLTGRNDLGSRDDLESRAQRWERNKTRLANAVHRGAAGQTGLAGAGGALDSVFANLSGRR